MPARVEEDSSTSSVLPLLEREHECATLRAVVAALAEGRSTVVVVRAEPGAGRSALLLRAVAEAESAGVVVAKAAARRFESGVGYGVLAQLCEVLPVDGGIPGAGEPGSPAEHIRLCSALLAVARAQPLLIVVDDLEWIDEDSKAVLAMLLRRVRQAPMAIVLGLSGWRPTLVEDDVLLDPDPITTLAPKRLSREAVRQVCAAALGSSLPADVVDVAVESTAGLPGLLVPALRRFGTVEHRSAATFARIVSDHRDARVIGLLEDLSTESLDLLRALAIAGEDVDLCFLRTLVGSAGDSPARLRAAGLAEGTDRMRLTAPVASLVLAGMSAEARGTLHASVAELAHRVAAPDVTVGRVLLGTVPFGAPWASGVLRRSAERAFRAGRDHDAIALLERALAEPVPSQVRAQIMVDLARAEARDRPRAGDRRLASALADNGPHRTRAAEMMVHGGDFHGVRRLVTVDPADRSTEQRCLEVIRQIALMSTDDGASSPLWTSADHPPVNDPVAAGLESWRLAVLGKDLARARELARLAVAPRLSEQPLGLPRLVASTALVLADELDEAQEAISVLFADARQRGIRILVSSAAVKLADVAHRAGRLTEAAYHVETALAALPLESWGPRTRTLPLCTAVLVDLDRGLLDDAVRKLETPLPPEAESGFGWISLLHARGAVRLALGDHEGALRNLTECGQRLSTRGWDNPALLDWRPLAAEAMVALGFEDGARALLADAHRAAAEWGTATCVGAARLAAAKLTRGPIGLRRAARAERALRTSPARLLHVEARVVLAECLLERSSFAAATELSRTASLTAREHGAAPLARRSDLLVKQCVQGAAEAARHTRPAVERVLTRLSRSQARVAELAGHGWTNARIAEELGITRRTVELHLTATYRTLGIIGRASLTGLLAGGSRKG
ncbi:MAG: AAA family ATPase [Umezawaea sp.]